MKRMLESDTSIPGNLPSASLPLSWSKRLGGTMKLLACLTAILLLTTPVAAADIHDSDEVFNG